MFDNSYSASGGVRRSAFAHGSPDATSGVGLRFTSLQQISSLPVNAVSFFNKLNLSNVLFLAPLAGITDTVFRLICKQYGCGMVFSEMINSNGVLKGGVKMLRKMDIHPDEEPVGIQIAGDNPNSMAEAAKMAVDAGAKLLNINMGCPAKQVTNSRAGCALMRDPMLVGQILKTVKQAIPIPLTLKIRLGWDDKSKNYLEIAQIAQNEGCEAVMMHARTRVQAFSGEAQWDDIRILKENLKISVIGNGDITSYSKAQDMMRQTHCDGVMIGRGALGKPWIFRPNYEPTIQERYDLMLDHFEKNISYYGEEMGTRLMQKHFAWYSHGLPKSAVFRNGVHRCSTSAQAKQYVIQFFENLS